VAVQGRLVKSAAMAAAQLFRQDSGAFPGRGMRNEHILRTGSHSESFYHDDKLVAQAPLPQPAGRHRLANSFGQADFAKMFEKEFGKSDGCAKVELSSQHSGELPSDCSKQHQSAFGLARQGSPVQHLYENGARCTVQITATGSPLAGGRPSPRFTAGKLEAATSGELRAAFLPSGDFSRTLLNSDSFGRRGSLGLTGLGAESPIASSVPMPASALQKAHFEAARGHFLADMDPGAMSPLSPCSTTSCRRLQELYGFFQTGGPLGRTNTEGQDELLAAVAVESSNGDFDLGDPAELQKLVSSDAMPSSPLPPISAGISASMPLQPISAPGAIVPSASLAPPVPAVQIVLANHDPADQELPPTPPLLRMLGGPPSPTHRQPGASTPSSPNRRQPSLPGDFVRSPTFVASLQSYPAMYGVWSCAWGQHSAFQASCSLDLITAISFQIRKTPIIAS